MSRPRTAQELIHWLDAGAGARWLRRAAFLALALVLSLRVGWTQFRGPQTEATLIQAETGRRLAVGSGFSTGVNFPQTAAVLKARGVGFDPSIAYPELQLGVGDGGVKTHAPRLQHRRGLREIHPGRETGAHRQPPAGLGLDQGRLRLRTPELRPTDPQRQDQGEREESRPAQPARSGPGVEPVDQLLRGARAAHECETDRGAAGRIRARLTGRRRRVPATALSCGATSGDSRPSIPRPWCGCLAP